MPKRVALRGKWKRYLAVALGLALVVAALAGIKFAQISQLIAYGEEMEAAGPPPEAVASAVARAQSWERTIEATGTIESVESVVVRNEVPTTVERIGFESGQMVEEGALLVELDTATERSQLAAAQARLRLARDELQRARQLVEQGAFARAQLDEAQAAYDVARGEVAQLQAQLAKKVIRAPFAGRTGIRDVDVGEYLEPGSRITALNAVGEPLVDFSVPQEEAQQIGVGMPVRVTLREGPDDPLQGRIAAVEPTVDPVTRNRGFRAYLDDPQEQLRPGMFADVHVILPEEQQVVAVPATSIVYASYGDSVFLIEEKAPDAPGIQQLPDGRPVRVARQQFVRVGAPRGDFVEVEEGLEPGREVVAAGAFKLRNGSPVVVDNTGQLEPKLNPTPENR